jgi:hypothetical protein
MKIVAWWNLRRLVILLVLLNAIDASSTYLLLHLSGGDPDIELNPLMRWAYIWDPVVCWLVKMLLVSGGLVIIARFATEKVARAVVASTNILYILTLCMHALAWLGH